MNIDHIQKKDKAVHEEFQAIKQYYNKRIAEIEDMNIPNFLKKS